jgi:hypothetical protein
MEPAFLCFLPIAHRRERVHIFVDEDNVYGRAYAPDGAWVMEETVEKLVRCLDDQYRDETHVSPGEIFDAILEATTVATTAAAQDLLRNKSNVCTINAQNRAGHTPLMYAAWLGRFELVPTLLECGADVHTRHNRASAIEYALRSEGTADADVAACIRYMRRRGAYMTCVTYPEACRRARHPEADQPSDEIFHAISVMRT